MLGWLLRRLLWALPTIWGVVTLVFVLVRIAPGDPVEAMLGERALPADRARLAHALGLDRPLPEQYLRFLGDALTGRWGVSIRDGRPVRAHLAERLPATLALATASLAFAVLVAMPMALFAARRRGRAADTLASTVALAGVSIPNFWLGPMLMLVFALQLGWLPVSGRETASSIVLPALTLGTALAAGLMRMTRASLLEAAAHPAMRTARAFGAGEREVWTRHIARLAAPPVITVFGLQMGALLGGAVITEVVFDWPGVGELFVRALTARDYPVVQGCMLVIAGGYVLANLAADLLAQLADPRQRGRHG